MSNISCVIPFSAKYGTNRTFFDFSAIGSRNSFIISIISVPSSEYTASFLSPKYSPIISSALFIPDSRLITRCDSSLIPPVLPRAEVIVDTAIALFGYEFLCLFDDAVELFHRLFVSLLVAFVVGENLFESGLAFAFRDDEVFRYAFYEYGSLDEVDCGFDVSAFEGFDFLSEDFLVDEFEFNHVTVLLIVRIAYRFRFAVSPPT